MRTARFLCSVPVLAVLLSSTAQAALFDPDGARGGAAEACTVAIAVRHAEKEAEGNDPGLTEAGRARARALAEALAEAHVQAILVSPTRRTRETAAPSAEQARVEPQAIPFEGGVEAHVAALAEAVRAEAGKTVLVVGHANTIPLLLRALGLHVGDLGDQEYGDLFVATLCPGAAPRLVKARYGSSAP